MIKLNKKQIMLDNNKNYIRLAFWFNDEYYSIFISKVLNHQIFTHGNTTLDIYEGIPVLNPTFITDKMEA